jgi:hypothetical protein
MPNDAEHSLEVAHARLDIHDAVLRRLERVADKALAASTDSAAAVREHTVKCEGRDATNAERFESIKNRLKNQDRILWAIISAVGAVATGIAVVAWDVLKAKLGIG